MNIESDSLDATLSAAAQASLDARVAAIEAEEAAALAAAAAEDESILRFTLSDLDRRMNIKQIIILQKFLK